MRLFSVALAAALALGLTACGDDDDDASAGSATSTALVSIDDEVLADAGGRTLYSADVEQGGEIRCEGGCTAHWAPVAASANEASAAADELGLELGTVMRPDGDEQLTLDGLPLYTFTDEGPGELTGDGFEDDFQGTTFVWEAARASAPAEEPADTGNSSPTPGY
jgi:predicted lipoprotein with Yx(FWY)xxD motif